MVGNFDFFPSREFPALLYHSRYISHRTRKIPVDRFASNTLRTLGIILTSIFVILGCLVLLLLALCFGIIANAGGSGHSDPQATTLAFGALVVAAVLIAVGVGIVTRLAKGIVRANNAPPAATYTLIPPIATTQPEPKTDQPSTPAPMSDEARLDQALASLEARTTKRPEPPKQPEPTPPTPPHVLSREPIAPRSIDVRHLSPASRTAIQQLGFAIAAKIVAEVALGIVGWYGALGVPRAPFPVYRFGFVAWGLAAIAPHIVLLYALARRPGPRAFAYSVVIPSLHLLFGFFGHSAFLAFILRAGQMATPFLSIAPWLLDILILYLAWKAIRQTGIEPNPARLIVASVVIFLYTSLLPVLVIILNQLRWR